MVYSRGSRSRNDLARRGDSIFERRDSSVELTLVDLLENGPHAGPGRDAQRKQVAAVDDWIGRRVLHTERTRAIEKPVYPRTIEVAGSAETIGERDPREQLEVHFLREPSECTIADRGLRLEERVGGEVVGDDPDDLRPHVESAYRLDIQAIEKCERRRHTRLFMFERSDPAIDDRRRGRLAQVMTDRTQASP